MPPKIGGTRRISLGVYYEDTDKRRARVRSKGKDLKTWVCFFLFHFIFIK